MRNSKIARDKITQVLFYVLINFNVSFRLLNMIHIYIHNFVEVYD